MGGCIVSTSWLRQPCMRGIPRCSGLCSHCCLPALQCLQDRQAGPGHVSAFTLGAPATALMVKEDHSMLGVGTAGW